jgi:lipoate-protein ligase A
MVRRPSGGETLVHHHEVTYCLALPAGLPWHDRRSWAGRMHEVIMAALTALGVTTCPVIQEQAGPSSLCFQHPTPGDVVAGQPGATSKVVGSAQRKRRGAILQHGAILLAASKWAPQLPGIQELTGTDLPADEVRRAIAREFTDHTGWPLILQEWTAQESQRIDELTRHRYAQRSWNEKR